MYQLSFEKSSYALYKKIKYQQSRVFPERKRTILYLFCRSTKRFIIVKDTLTSGVNFVLISANIEALPGRILL